jgi:Uma2 family endonuclease
MSAIPHQPMTMADFLDWEDSQPTKREFDGIQPIAMTGGSLAHAAIQANHAAALRPRLRGRPCQFYGPDLKIEVAGRIR